MLLGMSRCTCKLTLKQPEVFVSLGGRIKDHVDYMEGALMGQELLVQEAEEHQVVQELLVLHSHPTLAGY
jgi:hypothetical protein